MARVRGGEVIDVNATPRPGEATGKHSSQHGGGLAGHQVPDMSDPGAIFITERRVIQYVFDRVNAALGKELGPGGSDVLEVLYLCAERQPGGWHQGPGLLLRIPPGAGRVG